MPRLNVWCVVAILACLGQAGAEWPQWRGPARDGRAPDTGLLRKWPEKGPSLEWKATGLGEGYAGISIAQGRIYTQGQRGSDELLIAFDLQTGKKLWEVKNGREFRERRGHGPRGTPTVDGSTVYALAADGSLLAADAASGKRIWSLSFTGDFGGSVPHWGYSESPLVDGDNLIVTPGGKGAGVVALDKRTGKVRWKSQSDAAAYSSSVIGSVEGKKQLFVFTSNAALGLNPSNGELLWRYDKVANGTANIATPIFYDNSVFVSSDYGTGCALLSLAGGKMREVFFSREMKNHYSSSVLDRGYLYGFSSSILTAMRWTDGTVAWRDRSVGKGSVTFADGLLVVTGENGTVALVEANPDSYRELSRFTLPERSEFPVWAPPVVSGGRLYIRDQDVLFRYAIK